MRERNAMQVALKTMNQFFFGKFTNFGKLASRYRCIFFFEKKLKTGKTPENKFRKKDCRGLHQLCIFFIPEMRALIQANKDIVTTTTKNLCCNREIKALIDSNGSFGSILYFLYHTFKSKSQTHEQNSID